MSGTETKAAGEVVTLPPVADGWRVFPGVMHYYSKGNPLCGAKPIGQGVPYFSDSSSEKASRTNWKRKCRGCDERHTAMWCGRYNPKWESSVPHVQPDAPVA